MNRLSLNKRIAAISALTEGNSIRATERMVGAHRDTIMRLMVRVGSACEAFMDRELRGLPCKDVQVDELWGFVGKKHRNIAKGEDETRVGSFWIYCAIDADTRLVPCFKVGKRDRETTHAFIADLAERIEGRIQISSDALPHYVTAIDESFGFNIDYGKIVKFFESKATAGGPGKYSPPEVVKTKKTVVTGRPDMDRVSTSYCERLNLTTRMSMRRLTRLTNGFSKKPENLRAATALHFASYNYVKKHGTLKSTPARAAGVTDRVWSIGDLVALAD